MTKNIQIYLNSKRANKYIDNTNANCIFHLPYIHTTNKKNKVSISVLSAQIPCSYYNVNSLNNKLIYSVNNETPIEVNIIIGNYNINTLITYLKNEMPGFSIIYNASTNKLSFTHHISLFNFFQQSTCFELIGFSDKDHISTNNILVGDIVINLYTVQMLQIASDNFILDNIDSFRPNNSNILQSISVTSSYGSIVHYSNIHDIQSEIHSTRNLTNLPIQIIDQNDNVVELNGAHWSMVLLLTIA